MRGGDGAVNLDEEDCGHLGEVEGCPVVYCSYSVCVCVCVGGGGGGEK